MTALRSIAIASICALASLPCVSCGDAVSDKPPVGSGHEHVDGEHCEDHAAHAGENEHGPTVQLGEQELGGFKVRVSHDGEVTAGGDIPVDIWVNDGKGGVAVRFWIGTRDAKGSVKARADIEDGHWHTHCEAPDPMPEGAKLWVEVEAEGGARTVVGFDLKM